MAAPFGFLSQTTQWILLACFCAASLAMGGYLKKQGAPLKETEELGILAIEAPWTSARAAQIVEGWKKEDSMDTARTQVWHDFIFLLLYPVAFALICGLWANLVSGPLHLFGVMIAWCVLLAAPLDAVENGVILKMLSGAVHAPFPQIATIAAALKFTLLIGASAYVVFVPVFLLYQYVRAVAST